MTPKKWFFQVKIEKNGKLSEYEQQLSLILKNRDAKQLNSYTRKLFQDCFAFIKKKSGAENATPPALEFVKNQAVLDGIRNRINMFAQIREKPKYPPRSLILWKNSNATIFVNMGYFYSLILQGYQRFIINLTDNYFHELVHYFDRSKKEQEVHAAQCELLESFLGIRLPIEAKKIKSSEFYEEEPE